MSHESKTSEILLRIQDPAVTSRLVRASHRSSGFTHFFALKTVLFARQKDHPANSYIFLFDEPGIYLHPSGQYDLLQVLDAIGKHNQVVYSTHSLFMINKTFPIRHRLIVKSDGGTRVDGKPFVGRWGPAIEELGFSMAGTILFAQYVLLAEGDADPMLIQFLFQKLMQSNKANVDLNAFSVISTGDSQNTDAFIRILKAGAQPPNILVLVDGDRGGAERLKKIQPLLDGHNVRGLQLDDGLTTEDYLPSAGQHYVDAAADYAAGLAETLQTGVTRAVVKEKFEAAAVAGELSAGKLTSGIAEWALKIGKQAAKLKSKPSKVGIARQYIEQVAQMTFNDAQLERSVKLLKGVQEGLGIPGLRSPEMKITND